MEWSKERGEGGVGGGLRRCTVVELGPVVPAGRPVRVSAEPVQAARGVVPVVQGPGAEGGGEAGMAATVSGLGLFPVLPVGLTPLLFTPEQAGVLLAVSASWLRRGAAEGVIASTYVGRYLRFSPADMASIVRGGARGPRTRDCCLSRGDSASGRYGCCRGRSCAEGDGDGVG